MCALVTGVQTCALPIWRANQRCAAARSSALMVVTVFIGCPAFLHHERGGDRPLRVATRQPFRASWARAHEHYDASEAPDPAAHSRVSAWVMCFSTVFTEIPHRLAICL